MRCIQLGFSVGCLRVPQVHFARKHFVQKQTMCESVYTYLTICFAFEKPRWLLHNTADCAETVFSHLKCFISPLMRRTVSLELNFSVIVNTCLYKFYSEICLPEISE